MLILFFNTALGVLFNMMVPYFGNSYLSKYLQDEGNQVIAFSMFLLFTAPRRSAPISNSNWYSWIYVLFSANFKNED